MPATEHSIIIHAEASV